VPTLPDAAAAVVVPHDEPETNQKGNHQ